MNIFINIFMEVYLFYGGGHCKQVIDIFEENEIKIIGIFDDFKEKNTLVYKKYKVIDTISNAHKYIQNDIKVFCTIGDNYLRKLIFDTFKNNFINCISKDSYISDSVKIGSGNYIGVNAIILSDTIIGDNNIINTNANVAHDIIIGDHNHIAPSSTLSGNVNIGNLNLLGTNCTINPKIKIIDNNMIGSGAVIIRNIESNKKVVGNPGRYI